jgi:imidazolonepropionase-like amidohydrolase
MRKHTLAATLCLGIAATLGMCSCIHFPSYRSLIAPGASGRDGRIVFRDAAVFTATSTELLEHQDVWVSDGLITGIGPTGDVKPEAGVLVVEAKGKTLIPGLVDAHVHTTMNSLPPWYAVIPNAGHNLDAFLYAGITTVNDLGGQPEEIIGLRQEIAEGKRQGPRIFFAGQIITHKGGYPISMIRDAYGALAHAAIGTKLATEIESAAEGALAVRKRFAAGATMIKVVIADIPRGAPRISAEELDAIVHQAHQLGLKVAAHIDTTEDALFAAKHHVDALAHGVETTPLTPEQAKELAASGIVMVPTLVNYERFCQIAQKRYAPLKLTVESEPAEALAQFAPSYVDSAKLPDGFFKWGDELEANVKTRVENVRNAYAAGVPIIGGADAMGSVGTFAGDLHHELEMMVDAGIPPAEALLAGTSRSAKFITPQPSFGTIEVGKSADLLLIDGDPLKDISATQKLVMVLARGQVVERLTR